MTGKIPNKYSDFRKIKPQKLLKFSLKNINIAVLSMCPFYK